MSSNPDTPHSEPSSTPSQVSASTAPLPPDLPKLPGKNQRPGFCCIAVAAVIALIGIGVAIAIVLFVLGLFSANEAEETARRRTDKNHLEWVKNDDGKAAYSLAGMPARKEGGIV